MPNGRAVSNKIGKGGNGFVFTMYHERKQYAVKKVNGLITCRIIYGEKQYYKAVHYFLQGTSHSHMYSVAFLSVKSSLSVVVTFR